LLAHEGLDIVKRKKEKREKSGEKRKQTQNERMKTL